MINKEDANILIVDDIEDNRYTLERRLKRDGYTNIFLAEGGKTAIEMASENKFDLILLDLMMPDMSGLEVLKHLKGDPLQRSIPVIMVTASDEVETAAECIINGADDFITKPIKPKVLKGKLKSLLRRIEVNDSEVINLKNLTIDRNSYKVTIDNKEISLPRKEFELLFLLASSCGKVYKREHILESVWGKDVVVGDRTIDVHIRKLREKIGSSYLKTIKGVGYKLNI